MLANPINIDRYGQYEFEKILLFNILFTMRHLPNHEKHQPFETGKTT